MAKREPLKVRRFISIDGGPDMPWEDMTPEQEEMVKERLALNMIKATQDYYNRHPEEIAAFERGCRELDRKRELERQKLEKKEDKK